MHVYVQIHIHILEMLLFIYNANFCRIKLKSLHVCTFSFVPVEKCTKIRVYLLFARCLQISSLPFSCHWCCYRSLYYVLYTTDYPASFPPLMLLFLLLLRFPFNFILHAPPSSNMPSFHVSPLLLLAGKSIILYQDLHWQRGQQERCQRN